MRVRRFIGPLWQSYLKTGFIRILISHSWDSSGQRCGDSLGGPLMRIMCTWCPYAGPWWLGPAVPTHVANNCPAHMVRATTGPSGNQWVNGLTPCQHPRPSSVRTIPSSYLFSSVITRMKCGWQKISWCKVANHKEQYSWNPLEVWVETCLFLTYHPTTNRSSS